MKQTKIGGAAVVWSLVLLMGWVGVWALPPAAAQTAAGVLITELLPDPSGEDALEEWVEVANVGPLPLDISGYALGDEETVGQNEGMMRFPVGTVLEAGAVVVIAQDGPTFARRYGFSPDFEFKDGDPAVRNMEPAPDLAAGEIGLANGGDELFLLDSQGGIVDAISYGESSRVFQPPAPAVDRNVALQRRPANCDSDSAADWQTGPPDPGAIELDPACLPDEPAVGIMPIEAVQGSGATSPFVGEAVTVEGIVVGVQADRNASGVVFHTVYLQEPAVDGTDQAAASNGLPLFFGTTRPTVRLGDQLRVTGVITEFFGLTEISDRGLAVQTIGRDQPLPPPVPLTLLDEPLPGEALEGMRVSVADGVVLGPKYETEGGCGFAVTTAAADVTRLIRHEAGDAPAAVLPIMHMDETACDQLPPVKVGDRVSGLVGPLTYNFDLFRLVHQDPAGLMVDPAPLPDIPPPLRPSAGQITITSTNVENLFDEQDDTGDAAEPKLSAAEIDTKLRKISHMVAVTLGCPTVVAVQEVEKATLLQALTAKLQPLCGFTYDISHLESLDARGIDVALLTDPGRIEVIGVALRSTCVNFETSAGPATCPRGQFALFSRPPLAVELIVDNQLPLVVIVNHFKSKRGGEAETQPLREAQAAYVVDLVDEYRAAGRENLVVLGDFNDFADSRPLQIMVEDGNLENVLRRAPAESQYSFNFAGVSQLIDGILLSRPLAEAVEGVRFYHVNADFPDAWSTELNPPLLSFKATDHDPAVVLLTVQGDGDDPAELLPTPALSESPTVEREPVLESPTLPQETPGGWRWLIVGAILTAVIVGGAAIWFKMR